MDSFDYSGFHTSSRTVWGNEPDYVDDWLEEPVLTLKEDDWGTRLRANDLTDSITKTDEHAMGGGGFGDVYLGEWSGTAASSKAFLKKLHVPTGHGRKVAIKVIRPLGPGGKLREDLKRVSAL